MKNFTKFLLVLICLVVVNLTQAQISGTVFKDFNFNGTQQTSGFPTEPGMFGVQVKAFNAANIQLGITKKTDVNGAYSFTAAEIPSATAVRIEFTATSGTFSAKIGTANGTDVQFVTAPSTTVNYAVANQDWYSNTANPYVAANGFTNGDAVSGGAGSAGVNNNLYVFPYTMRNAGNTALDDGGSTRRRPNSELGSVFGMAFQKPTRTLLMAAYLKRHSGFGPNGIGAIYKSTVDATGVPGAATLLVNVSAIGINVGTNPRTVALPATSSTRNADVGVFAEVGKRGIGGIDISDDGKDLYLVNMFEKKLQRINIGSPLKTSFTAADVTGSWVITDPATAGMVWHPMACKTANGKVYVGGVVVKETSTTHSLADTVGARGVVYEFDPATNLFTEVLRYGLDYRRGFSNNDFRYPTKGNWWCGWQSNGNGGAADPIQADYNTANGAFTGGVYYPQPMLATIEFDVDGSMLLGIRDRFGDQMGYQNLSNDGLPTGTGFGAANNFFRALTSGEILRAGKNLAGSAYAMEVRGQATNLGITTGTLDAAATGNPTISGNWSPATSGTPWGGFYGPGWGGTAGTVPGGGPNPGTRGGYFYFNHNFTTTGTGTNGVGAATTLNGIAGTAINAHYQKSDGGLALLAGSNEVLTSLMDPVDVSFANGAIRLINSGANAGTMAQRLQLVVTVTGAPGDPTNCGKSNGLGDVEVLGDYQPIEVGNRVWNDANGNGIQDAGEAGINGVTVQLVSPGPDGIFGNADDVVVATVATATVNGQSGSYFFSTLLIADARKPATFIGVGANDILPGFDYQVRILNAAGTLQQASLAGLQLSRINVGANSSDNIDNDGLLNGNDAGIIFNTANSDHSFDIGFKPLASIGDRIWRDDNKNGSQDAGEPGIAGITITLYRPGFGLDGIIATADDALPVASIVTDSYGNYLFDNLTAGNYQIQVNLSGNYQFTTQTNTIDNTDGVATRDNGSDVNATTGLSYTIVLSAGENKRNIDAGLIFNVPAAVSSIGDKVWYDANSNGTFDAGEPGMSNVTVTLYKETTAGSGVYVVYAATVTDANGNYIFNNLPNNTNYKVGITPPAGTLLTSSTGTTPGNATTDSDLDPTTRLSAAVNIPIGGSQITGIDVGLILQPTTRASLGDRAWYDTNRDGDQDAGEPGIEGVTVQLLNAANTVLATTTTDAFGNYIFTNLLPGGYRVSFGTVTGMQRTAANATGGTIADITDSDADPTTGRTQGYTLNAGGKNMSVDAGYYSTQPAANVGALGNKVWIDSNGDGIQDAMEPLLGGVTVTLYNSAGAVIATTTTDIDGNYLFTNLAPGSYSVGFSNLPASYGFTGQNKGGNTTVDSDVNPATGRTVLVTVVAGATTSNINAGVRLGAPSGLGSLGNKVFVDIPGGIAGQQDAGELGIPNVTIQLYLDANGDGLFIGAEQIAIATTITNALGEYLFTGLAAGTYQVAFSNLPAGYTVTTKNAAGVSVDEDSDGNPVNIAVNGNPAVAGKSYTGLVSLAQGEDNLSIDLGLITPANSNSLGNFVWVDANSNGVQDAVEPGVPGVTAILYNNTGTAIAVSTTDITGQYLFTGLADGNYSAGFSNFPAGYDLTVKSVTNDLTGSDADRVSGRTATITLNYTAGGTNRDNRSLDAGLITTRAALGDRVWSDLNDNGIQDAGEPGIEGVTVSLFHPGFGLDGIAGNADDALAVASMVTDKKGNYFFSNLIPGDYQLEFTTIPTGMLFTRQNTPGDNQNNTNSDAVPANANGRTGTINLSAGENDLTVDAGLTVPRPATIGNFVWDDFNANGLQDTNEPGIGGILVTLYNSLNQPISSAVTDGNGKWQIMNIAAGTGYYVIFSPNLPSFNITASPGSNPAWTAQNLGANGTASLDSGTESDVDSDVTVTGANAGRTAAFNIVAGNNFPNIDAGIINWARGNVLPIQLLSFTAQPQGNHVQLNWVVGTEINVSKYEVIYSSNGTNFTPIGSQPAANSRNYSLVHTSPQAGLNYYRLKVTDIDGSVSYSEIRKVKFGKAGDNITLYPIPAKTFVNVTVGTSMINKPATISILSIDGRLQLQQAITALNQTETINLGKLVSGKYIVSISINNEVINKQIEVIK